MQCVEYDLLSRPFNYVTRKRTLISFQWMNQSINPSLIQMATKAKQHCAKVHIYLIVIHWPHISGSSSLPLPQSLIPLQTLLRTIHRRFAPGPHANSPGPHDSDHGWSVVAFLAPKTHVHPVLYTVSPYILRFQSKSKTTAVQNFFINVTFDVMQCVEYDLLSRAFNYVAISSTLMSFSDGNHSKTALCQSTYLFGSYTLTTYFWVFVSAVATIIDSITNPAMNNTPTICTRTTRKLSRTAWLWPWLISCCISCT